MTRSDSVVSRARMWLLMSVILGLTSADTPDGDTDQAAILTWPTLSPPSIYTNIIIVNFLGIHLHQTLQCYQIIETIKEQMQEIFFGSFIKDCPIAGRQVDNWILYRFRWHCTSGQQQTHKGRKWLMLKNSFLQLQIWLTLKFIFISTLHGITHHADISKLHVSHFWFIICKYLVYPTHSATKFLNICWPGLTETRLFDTTCRNN